MITIFSLFAGKAFFLEITHRTTMRKSRWYDRSHNTQGPWDLMVKSPYERFWNIQLINSLRAKADVLTCSIASKVAVNKIWCNLFTVLKRTYEGCFRNYIHNRNARFPSWRLWKILQHTRSPICDDKVTFDFCHPKVREIPAMVPSIFWLQGLTKWKR